jgi:hypothetical protein
LMQMAGEVVCGVGHIVTYGGPETVEADFGLQVNNIVFV